MLFTPPWRCLLEAVEKTPVPFFASRGFLRRWLPAAAKKTPVPFFVLLLMSSAAGAQPVGTRAQGMAGAFTAVADDATSVYWNPAGMATGAFVSFVLDYGDGQGRPDEDRSPEGAFDSHAAMLAFTLPPLGLSYYRLGSMVAEPRATVETAGPVREDGRRNVHGLTTSNVGVTLAQSISEYLVVAGTIRYVSGEVTSGTVLESSAGAALDRASGLPQADTSRVDVDAGLMLAVERLRVGFVARNLVRPGFDLPGTDAGEVHMEREVRVGAAWGNGWPGRASLVVSADADVTRRDSPTGERRDVAVGVETWWLGQRLGVRGGVRGSTTGGTRGIVATGLSVAVRNGIFVEGHAAGGDAGERAWGIGVRFTY